MNYVGGIFRVCGVLFIVYGLKAVPKVFLSHTHTHNQCKKNLFYDFGFGFNINIFASFFSFLFWFLLLIAFALNVQYLLFDKKKEENISKHKLFYGMRCIRVKTHFYWLLLGRTRYSWARICLSHFFHFNSKHYQYFPVSIYWLLSLQCIESFDFQSISVRLECRRFSNGESRRSNDDHWFNGSTIIQPFKVAQPLSLAITIKHRTNFQSQLLFIYSQIIK